MCIFVFAYICKKKSWEGGKKTSNSSYQCMCVCLCVCTCVGAETCKKDRIWNRNGDMHCTGITQGCCENAGSDLVSLD